jgi:hypothetical protein
MDRDQEIENRLKDFYSGKADGKYDSKPMNTFRVLILEDDLRTLSFLLNRIGQLEEKLKKGDIAVTVLSEYTQVEEYINNTKMDFDIILLDRDCKSCGSFHVLDFEKFGVDKIISISAIPEWNEEAKKRGVKRIILKDHENIESFADKVAEEIKSMILN